MRGYIRGGDSRVSEWVKMYNKIIRVLVADHITSNHSLITYRRREGEGRVLPQSSRLALVLLSALGLALVLVRWGWRRVGVQWKPRYEPPLERNHSR